MPAQQAETVAQAASVVPQITFPVPEIRHRRTALQELKYDPPCCSRATDNILLFTLVFLLPVFESTAVPHGSIRVSKRSVHFCLPVSAFLAASFP